MCRIPILADIRSMRHKLSYCGKGPENKFRFPQLFKNQQNSLSKVLKEDA